MIRIILAIIMSLGSLLGFSQTLGINKLNVQAINIEVQEKCFQKLDGFNTGLENERSTLNEGIFDVSDTNITFDNKL